MGILSNLLKGTVVRKELVDVATSDLEKIIARRYKARAPQSQLDTLETEFAKRVTPEENLANVDMEPEPSAGVSLEEQLSGMFHLYKNGSRNGMAKEDILTNMRTSIENAGGTRQLNDKSILSAAEDIYNYNMKLRNNRQG